MMTACKTTEVPYAGGALNSLTGQHDETEERLSTAAAHAIAEGKTEEALALYEKLYNQPSGIFRPNKGNQDVTLNYAQLLRKAGKAQEAHDVLRRFVENRRGEMRLDVEPIVMNEFAAINIDLGNFNKAEMLLNQVLENKTAESLYPDAYNLLGIVLAAKGAHKEAEEAFRQALAGWKGDSTSVMNNLGLCLASQGLFDESLTTLRQALMTAPHKQEIARNIQLVDNLRKSVLPKAPVALNTK